MIILQIEEELYIMEWRKVKQLRQTAKKYPKIRSMSVEDHIKT